MLHPTENTVDQRAPSGARFQAPDFASGAAALARGGEQLGAGLGQAADVATKIGEEYDVAAVKQADAEDMTQITKIRANVLSSRGFDTQDAIATARSQIAELRKSRLATLHSKNQQRMYADIFDRRNMAMEETFSTHSASQIAEANDNAAKDRAATYSDAAVRSFGTPEFDHNVATAMGEVAAVNRGQLPDVIGRQQFKARSAIIQQAIEGMTTDPDQAEHAKIAIDKYASQLTPEHERALRKLVNPILDENRTDADAGWAFTNDGAPGVRDDLAPAPEGGEPPTSTHPADTSATPPRPTIHSGAGAAEARPISPADPLRGKGRITDNAAAHRLRGSGNALDIAAPAGTPIYTPMSGTVVKNWWDKKGGWSILVQHPNGYVTGYAHMRSQSPLEDGAHVEPTTPIGSVGATGDATGPHVHYTVRQTAAGPKVDPSAALWDSKGTKAPDSVSWKEGQLQQYQADNNSVGRALSRLHDRATAENWSDYRYNKAVDRVRQIAGVQEQMYNKQQEDMYDQALSTVVQLDEKFTSVSQIPGFGNLDPKHQYTLQNIADANRKAAADGGLKANGPEFMSLLNAATDPALRQGFLAVDLGRANVTPGERSRLLEMRNKLRNEPNGALAANLDTTNHYANRYFPGRAGQTPDAALMAKRQQFSDRMAAAIERQQGELGRPLTSREADDVARALAVQVTRNGTTATAAEIMGSGQGGTVNIQQTFNTIAPDIRQNIANDLARRGLDHSPKAVVAEWLRSRAR